MIVKNLVIALSFAITSYGAHAATFAADVDAPD